MEQTHGTWGDRIRVFQNDTCLVTVLRLEKMQRCSWHSHKTAYNLFFVESGSIGVKTDKGFTKITKGQSFTVEPGVMHEFQTGEDNAVVVEIAYVYYNENDIHRETLGGKLEQAG